KIDATAFQDYVADTGATICGRVPIAVLLTVLERTGRPYRCELIEYTTSGRLTHDHEHSVSYTSIAVLDEETADDDGLSPAENAFPLSDDDKALLLRLARQSIRTRLEGRAMPSPEPTEISDTLKTVAACFVTLHIGDSLRGCIGHLDASEPLDQNVLRNARHAAFDDPRFNPVTEEELDRIRIEISVLTPRVPIRSPEEFIVGRHGIILSKGRREAVFLPQVAPEEGWDRETTLEHLSRKAGLKPDAWRRDAKFYVFEAIVFGEEDDVAWA
ncbi:MAG: AmmeMemoRadiSam system protein A, partial [Planctomycetes bacterium]|nr:AmmeMemoRadiSam system protein A [Planctomycetota bacterium]